MARSLQLSSSSLSRTTELCSDALVVIAWSAASQSHAGQRAHGPITNQPAQVLFVDTHMELPVTVIRDNTFIESTITYFRMFIHKVLSQSKTDCFNCRVPMRSFLFNVHVYWRSSSMSFATLKTGKRLFVWASVHFINFQTANSTSQHIPGNLQKIMCSASL